MRMEVWHFATDSASLATVTHSKFFTVHEDINIHTRDIYTGSTIVRQDQVVVVMLPARRSHISSQGIGGTLILQPGFYRFTVGGKRN
jgi:hypothetical protein